MKKIVKGLVPALLAAVLCLGIAACSDPAIDYSTWTYGDFQAAEAARVTFIVYLCRAMNSIFTRYSVFCRI